MDRNIFEKNKRKKNLNKNEVANKLMKVQSRNFESSDIMEWGENVFF